jgi:hypothetical protein
MDGGWGKCIGDGWIGGLEAAEGEKENGNGNEGGEGGEGITVDGAAYWRENCKAEEEANMMRNGKQQEARMAELRCRIGGGENEEAAAEEADGIKTHIPRPIC